MRRRELHQGLALLAGVLLCWPAVAAPRVDVDVQSDLDCVAEAKVRAAIERHLSQHDGFEGKLTVRLLDSGGLALTLVDRSGATVGGRALEIGPDDCPELPQTIALIVEAWIASPPQLALPHAPVAVAPAEAPVALPALPSPQPLETRNPAPEPATRNQLTIAIEGGGFILGAAEHLEFQGGGAIGWRLGDAWGAALHVSADRNVTVALGNVTVDANSQSFDLCAEMRLHPIDSATLNLQLGPSVQRIAATSRGLSENSSATLWDFGGAAIVEWEQHLVSRLFLVVGVRAGLKLHDDAFTVHIDGTDTKILTMSALRFSASLGLGWQLL